MRPFDLVVLPPILLITLWKARALPGAPRRERALWGVWACWTASVIMGVPAVRRVIDGAVGVQSFTNVPVHVASLAAVTCLVEFTREVTGARNRRATAITLGVLGAAAAGLLAAFAAMPHPDGDTDLLTAGASSPSALAYWAILLVYVSFGLVSTTQLCWRYAPLAAPGPSRTSLRLMQAASMGGLLYVLHRLVFLTSRAAGCHLFDSSAVAGTTQVLLAFTLVLLVLSILWPTLAERRQRLRDRRNARRVEPLWRLLQQATPEVVLPLPEELRRDPRLLLYRRIIEIRDSALALDGHLTEADRTAAEARLTALGVAGKDLAPAVEAVLLRTAVAAELERRPAGAGERTLVQDGMDLTAEVRWFVRVAVASRSAAVLAVAEGPGTQAPAPS
ncbi:MAB_1171c family putative transporter [Kitasatospora sp. NPDC094015]|uniref:MAB_1171c family putative transporter n=1 Tax=Kitasatospora sp. NPDC094015 TaxID=3155205 RepID=UPI00332B11E9